MILIAKSVSRGVKDAHIDIMHKKMFSGGGAKEKWEPEQITGRLKSLEKRHVSHETIYRFLFAGKAVGVGAMLKKL